MKANEVPVGYYFIGHVDRDDWFMEDKRLFTGDKINIVALIPHNDAREESSLLMNLYAGLRADNSHQLSNSFSMWVAGARLKRSKYVRVHDWLNPLSIVGAEKISTELYSKIGNADGLHVVRG
jgi:hypothetical protein